MRRIIIKEEQLNKIFLNEYLDRNFAMPLMKYFSMDQSDKEMYILDNYIDRFGDYAVNEYRMTDEMLEQIKGMSEDEIKESLMSGELSDFYYDFMEYIYSMFDSNWYEAPAFFTFSDPRIVKNEWLIHFSNNAAQVSHNGFKYGTSDIDRLAFTSAGDLSNKYGEGYDFAFPLDDFEMDYSLHGRPKYGREAVIFRASGVKVYHEGDNEDQVIFWGPSAKDFIYVRYDDEYKWCLMSEKNGNVLFHTDDLEDLTEWVLNHMDQYRKHLFDYKGNKNYEKYYQ